MSHAALPRATRGRDIHEQHRTATPLELLFDLTFVVAVALAAAQLHHAEGEGHVLAQLPNFLLTFFAIWWAWMNYTWFASAYDNDDLPYRLLTLLQMAGALVFAAGVPSLFQGQTLLAVVGYAAMRLPLCLQWLRAGAGDPLRRATCLRYAAGVAAMQLLWIAHYLAGIQGWLAPALAWPALITLVLLELAVPLWAESRGPGTPWHAHHIAERYSGFVIIILGESILGTANALSKLIAASGLSGDLALVGLGGALLVFALWWMYFCCPRARRCTSTANAALAGAMATTSPLPPWPPWVAACRWWSMPPTTAAPRWPPSAPWPCRKPFMWPPSGSCTATPPAPRTAAPPCYCWCWPASLWPRWRCSKACRWAGGCCCCRWGPSCSSPTTNMVGCTAPNA